jgi:hypothetical protein
LKSHLNQLLELIDIPDDYEIRIENKRCKLPTAAIYPNRKLIVITANKPSLIRYAIGELILHEIAHDEFHKVEPEYEGDSHLHPDFQLLENAWRNVLVRAIEDEHE